MKEYKYVPRQTDATRMTIQCSESRIRRRGHRRKPQLWENLACLSTNNTDGLKLERPWCGSHAGGNNHLRASLKSYRNDRFSLKTCSVCARLSSSTCSIRRSFISRTWVGRWPQVNKFKYFGVLQSFRAPGAQLWHFLNQSLIRFGFREHSNSCSRMASHFERIWQLLRRNLYSIWYIFRPVLRVDVSMKQWYDSSGNPNEVSQSPIESSVPKSGQFGFVRHNGQWFHDSIDCKSLIKSPDGFETDSTWAFLDRGCVCLNPNQRINGYRTYLVFNHAFLWLVIMRQPVESGHKMSILLEPKLHLPGSKTIRSSTHKLPLLDAPPRPSSGHIQKWKLTVKGSLPAILSWLGEIRGVFGSRFERSESSPTIVTVKELEILANETENCHQELPLRISWTEVSFLSYRSLFLLHREVHSESAKAIIYSMISDRFITKIMRRSRWTPLRFSGASTSSLCLSPFYFKLTIFDLRLSTNPADAQSLRIVSSLVLAHRSRYSAYAVFRLGTMSVLCPTD
jgi:hypothetical protein